MMVACSSHVIFCRNPTKEFGDFLGGEFWNFGEIREGGEGGLGREKIWKRERELGVTEGFNITFRNVTIFIERKRVF